MSGIVGLFYKDGKVARKHVLQQMLATIAERGKDLQSLVCREQTGFGHALLRTTPEDIYDNQPILCKESGLMLVADARVDNRQELVRQLELRPGVASALPDSALILHAYKKWQQETPRHIIGDFAFAVWDSRKKQLFCARDRVGVRPLYYLDTPTLFAFSSEIKTLLSLQVRFFAVNESAVAAYLLRSIHSPAETFYKDIHRLLPATVLKINPAQLHTATYWSTQNLPPVEFQKDSDYGEAFYEIFQKAVNCRLRSTTVVGAALSGGLDSSSIVCTAVQQLAPQENNLLHTYSVVFNGLSPAEFAKVDEQEYIKAVLATAAVKHQFINASNIDPLKTLDQEIAWHDEPFFNPNLYIHRAMYGAARRNRQRVFLDGLDGDTVVSHGYELLPDLLAHGNWHHFLQEIAALKRNSNSSLSIARLSYRYGIKPFLQAIQARRNFRQWSQKYGAESSVMGSDILSAAYRQKQCTQAIIRNRHKEAVLPVSNARGYHAAVLAQPHLMYALELGNHVAARYTLEERFPFLDARVIEFCVAIPPKQKFAKGWSRMLLRRAMDGILPPEVQWRLTKARLSPHFLQKMKKQPLLSTIDLSALEPMVNDEYLQRFQVHDQKKTMLLNDYAMLCLAKWLKKIQISD